MGARSTAAGVDRDLVAAAQRGDREAYVDLIRPRADRLYAVAHRILRDVDRAEDAVQDALVVAWRDLRGLRDPDRFDAWLHRLLVHVCIAEATRERRRVTNLRVLPVDGPAGPDEFLGSPIATSSNGDSGACRRTSGRSWSSTTTRATPRPRSRRPSGSRPAPPAPDSTMPIAPCEPPSRPTREARSPEDVRHDPRARDRTRPRCVAGRRTDGGPGPRLRRGRRPDRAAVPATRVAPAWRVVRRVGHLQPVAAIAAVIVVAVVGFNLLPLVDRGVVGGPPPTASPSPQPEPSAAPVRAGVADATSRGTRSIRARTSTTVRPDRHLHRPGGLVAHDGLPRVRHPARGVPDR